MSYHIPTGSINFDQFHPGTSNPARPQEMWKPEGAGPKYLSTDGFFGDLTPARPDFSDFPVALLLVGGIVIVGGAVAFMLSGNEPRRAF